MPVSKPSAGRAAAALVPLLIALMAGCAGKSKAGLALNAEERKEYISLYGAFLSESKRTAFMEGRVIPGMPKELVERVLGQPRWTAVERYGIEWTRGYDSTYLAVDPRDSLWLYYAEDGSFRRGLLFQRDTLAESIEAGKPL